LDTKINKAVFIDRDGTIAKDVPYCSRPEDFELLPNVAEGIKLLNKHGFKVVVVTNQSGISRGYFTKETLAKIHDKMRRELARFGARLDAIYYCPHHPDDNCECRKPKPRMLFQAASDLNIDLGQSYVIGDNNMDIEMGRNAGCKTLIIKPSMGRSSVGKLDVLADFVVFGLYEAAQLVLQDSGMKAN